jgi:uncharacterized SAM-dependent methyltransferase
MLYFKHSELVDTYHVSLKTVHNWIDASKQGKLDLELYDKNGRTYIANKPSNTAKLQKMSDEGKKYRNARFHKIVSPNQKFYDTYSKRQILDIISNLNIHREIPRQYNYLDGGATNWDNWVKRLSQEVTPNLYNNTVELLGSNLGPIDALIKNHHKINIIDLGAGTGESVKGLLAHLLNKDVINRYIAVDISQTMLNIVEKNLKDEFGDKLKFEGHVRDLRYERFDDLVVDDMLDDANGKVMNLVLFLGLTPMNFRSTADVLKVVYGSMSEDDLLLYDCKPDTAASRQYFDFGRSTDSVELSPNHKLILEMMNIDSSLYDVETGFNEKKRMRYIRIRLKAPITIKFEFNNSERSVTLEKGETILMLRVWHMTALETIAEFQKIGFVLLHSSMTKEREGLLTISGIDTKSDTSA